MEQILLQDNMDRESRRILYWLIGCLVLSAVYILVVFLSNDYKNLEIVKLIIFCVIISCIFLYGYLYTKFYQLTVSESILKYKSLFKKFTLEISEIEKYEYKRYSKVSKYYIFKLFSKNKCYKVSTKYKDDLLKILSNI